MNQQTSRAWVVFTRLLLIALFVQVIFAGFLLSGEGWGQTAHRLTAFGLVAITLLGGVMAAATIWRIPEGRRLALALIALGLLLAVQTAIGMLAADGENLLWLHVPLGVALVGFAAELVGVSRNLAEDEPASDLEPAREKPYD